jgi:hypothetical protein
MPGVILKRTLVIPKHLFVNQKVVFECPTKSQKFFWNCQKYKLRRDKFINSTQDLKEGFFTVFSTLLRSWGVHKKKFQRTTGVTESSTGRRGISHLADLPDPENRHPSALFCVATPVQSFTPKNELGKEKAPDVGLEPTTTRLRVVRSTD